MTIVVCLGVLRCVRVREFDNARELREAPAKTWDESGPRVMSLSVSVNRLTYVSISVPIEFIYKYVLCLHLPLIIFTSLKDIF